MHRINCFHRFRNCLLIPNESYTKNKILKIKCYFKLHFSAFDFMLKILCYNSAVHFRLSDSERAKEISDEKKSYY